MGQDIATQDYSRHKADFYRAFERFFGAKGRKIDETILNGYWHHLGNYPLDSLSKALDILAIGGNEYMPDAGAIAAEIRAIRERDSRVDSIAPAWCDHCRATGIVTVGKLHNGVVYNTAYRCVCENGRGIDARIRGVDPRILEPPDAPEKKLPLVTLEIIRTTQRDYVWDGGVDLAKICDDCKRPYTLRYDRPISCAELQDDHIRKRTRPHQCDPCFIEEGRRAGYWR